MKKGLVKALIISGCAVVALIILVTVLAVRLHADSQETKYTEESLAARVGADRLYAQDSTFGGENCKFCRTKGEHKMYYDYLEFYIYDNEKKAKKAFDEIENTRFNSIYDSGSDYIYGDESDVYDAEIDWFVYRTGNMIITTEITVYSEWPVEPGDTSPGGWSTPFGKEEMMNKIKTLW